MATSSFTSFHYERDHWRIQQVLKMGAIEGQPIMSPQKWEEVKKDGVKAIEKWIADQMKGKSAVVILVGKETASRDWVDYEIRKAWNDKKPLVGIRIHGLKDQDGLTDTQGANPFANITIGGVTLSSRVSLHAPTGTNSQAIYQNIDANLATWVAGPTSEFQVSRRTWSRASPAHATMWKGSAHRTAFGQCNATSSAIHCAASVET